MRKSMSSFFLSIGFWLLLVWMFSIRDNKIVFLQRNRSGFYEEKRLERASWNGVFYE